MAKLRLKTGEVLELPLDEAIEFMVCNPDLIAPLNSGMPKPKRPLLSTQEILQKTCP